MFDPILPTLGFSPVLVILLVAPSLRAERKIVSRLSLAGATSAPTAVSLEELRGLALRRLRHLVRRGAVVEAGSGRYYLDTAAWQARRQGMRMAFLALAFVLTLATLAVLLFLR
jgi:hypothetical protein